MAALSPWTFIIVGTFVSVISLFNQFKMDNSIGFFQYVGYLFIAYGIIRLTWKMITGPKAPKLTEHEKQHEEHHINRNSHTYPHHYGQQQHNPYAQQQKQINPHVRHHAQQQQTQQSQPGNHQQSALFCRNCGKRITMQDNFCPHCGIRMR